MPKKRVVIYGPCSGECWAIFRRHADSRLCDCEHLSPHLDFSDFYEQFPKELRGNDALIITDNKCILCPLDGDMLRHVQDQFLICLLPLNSSCLDEQILRGQVPGVQVIRGGGLSRDVAAYVVNQAMRIRQGEECPCQQTPDDAAMSASLVGTRWQIHNANEVAENLAVMLAYHQVEQVAIYDPDREQAEAMVNTLRHQAPGLDIQVVEDYQSDLASADVVVLTRLVLAGAGSDAVLPDDLVDAGFISGMKPGATLINLAQAKAVTEDALIKALGGKRIRYVFDQLSTERCGPESRLEGIARSDTARGYLVFTYDARQNTAQSRLHAAAQATEELFSQLFRLPGSTDLPVSLA